MKSPKAQNGSSTSPDSSDPDYITIRINKSLLYGAFCAAMGALAVIVAQRISFDISNIPNLPAFKTPSQNVQSEKDEVLMALELQKSGNYIHEPYLEPEDHPNPNVRQLPRNLSNWPYGALGLGVDVDVRKLSTSEAARKEEMYKSHAFEEYVSELIPLNRTLPDFRGDWCKRQYDGQPDLKPVSIIICFHNEAWSTLLRTVRSVVGRSPKRLIAEILLVDDKSTYAHLGRKLDDRIAKEFPEVPIKILRQKRRQGLMRSRMVGIDAARRDTVLLFLDSHVEATTGWLEPLLTRIKENPRLIISPQIDHISDSNFFYKFVDKDVFGIINWNMIFEWHEVSRDDIAKKPDRLAPHATPVMAGGLFAIERDFFEEIGYYDTGMEIWGAENIELSFKAWMCGGRIEISPCSHVGHVFRSWSPYEVGAKDLSKNRIRTAEVWMDEFKNLYYHRLGGVNDPLADRLGDFGDVSERIALRNSLKCRSFKWYMDNVAMGLPYPHLIGVGEVKNVAHDLCIDKNDHVDFMDHPVGTEHCHGLNDYQYWWFNINNYWLRDYQCVGVTTGDGETVTVTDCGRSGTWVYDVKEKRLRHDLTGKCLAVATENRDNNFIRKAVVKKCTTGSDEDQEWVIQQYNRKGISYDKLLTI